MDAARLLLRAAQLPALLTTLNNIKLTASKLECLELDLQEFAYLRLFSLFRFNQPSELLRKVTDPISECVLSSFRRYYEYYDDTARTGRLGKILLSSLYIDSSPADQLEQLFFSGIIGSVNIDSVVPYILSMEIPGQYSHDSHTLHEEEGETEDSETENQS